ncbi:hypothetical protein BGZ97_001279, partial [Linnemannia gamsii]
MRLITIGLGACAIFALSTVQAQEAAAPADAGGKVILAEEMKKKVIYPSLSELESRVQIFNAFVADKHDLSAADKKVIAAEPKAKEEAKKTYPAAVAEKAKEVKEKKTTAAAAEEKKAAKLAKEKKMNAAEKKDVKEKKKAQKAFKASSAKKKSKAVKKTKGGHARKEKAGHHGKKAAAGHGNKKKAAGGHYYDKKQKEHNHQNQQKEHKQQHHQYADKLDHSHHQKSNTTTTKKKHPHAKQHHHQTKTHNNDKPTKTKHDDDDCIVYETITVVPRCKPTPSLCPFPVIDPLPDVDTGRIPNPFANIPPFGGLIPPIETDHPGVDSIANPAPGHGSILDNNDDDDEDDEYDEDDNSSILDGDDGGNDSFAPKPDLPLIPQPASNVGSAPDTSVAQPAPVDAPVRPVPSISETFDFPATLPGSLSNGDDDSISGGINPPSSSSANPELN